jgi:hypothetical protein
VWTRFIFAAMVLISSLIALFVGPSAALLMIPTTYTAWPAGGADFWMNEGLFPTSFDINLLGNENGTCTGSAVDLSAALPGDWRYADCPWAGWTYLSESLAQRYLGPIGISYQYGTFTQSLNTSVSEHPPTVESTRAGAIASNLAMGAYLRNLAFWWNIAVGINNVVPSGYGLRNLQYSGNSRLLVKSSMPLVRTQCLPHAEDHMTGAPQDLQIAHGHVLIPVSATL